MTTVDELWFRASEANQQAEQAYHRLTERYDPDLEFERGRHVSRRRFRTLVDRVAGTGAPYGAHTIVYRPDASLLLVRHEGIDMWVLPGGEVEPDEEFREAARRELSEEAGVEASYDGLAVLTRVGIECAQYTAWGVLPVFAARAETTEPTVSDPDGEISEAAWFDTLPEDTRDRADLLTWRERRFET
ncbi:NUDIX hydrolase [Natronorarus salvus]|uniref:NUDIX hydrolase n=1 Tax=Natronorarus salvus TaxID=3117733 RepID=UPI002F269A7B